MRLTTGLALLALLAGCAAEHEPAAAQGPRITNYEAPGNLQAQAPLGCVELSEVSNHNTPADLFPGVQACMEKREFRKAAKLFALAGVYGRVDQLRVADRSAHQAVTVLKMKHLGGFPKDDAKALTQGIMSIANDPKALGVMCADIRTLGPPDYYPAYMVQHGMGAFLGHGDAGPIRADFRMDAAWEKALDGYLHCPPA